MSLHTMLSHQEPHQAKSSGQIHVRDFTLLPLEESTIPNPSSISSLRQAATIINLSQGPHQLLNHHRTKPSFHKPFTIYHTCMKYRGITTPSRRHPWSPSHQTIPYPSSNTTVMPLSNHTMLHHGHPSSTRNQGNLTPGRRHP